MYNRIYKCSAILLALLCLLVAPVGGALVTVTYSNGAGGAMSASTTAHLDNPTSFKEVTVLGSGVLYQTGTVSGSGQNSLVNKIAGEDGSVESVFIASGTVHSQTSALSSGDGAVINSGTQIVGDAGYISSRSDSMDNCMTVVGGFSGDGGYLNADLTSITGDRAVTGGTASMLEVNCLYEGMYVPSGVAMEVNGLYLAREGNIGKFGLAAVNEEKSGKSPPKKGKPGQSLDDPNSFKLTGYMLPDDDGSGSGPNCQLYLNPTGLSDVESASNAIAIRAAAETWDSVTGKNLFVGPVEVTSDYGIDVMDGHFTHGWKDIPSDTTLGYARTWYRLGRPTVPGADGKLYRAVVESDVCYNTKFNWDTYQDDGTTYVPGDNIDVQTVALHELGHTIGLGDIYGTRLEWDTAQIMNYYGDVQRVLGNGDTTGAQKLYGASAA